MSVSPPEPAPVVFDPLQPSAERILQQHFGCAIRIADAALLTEPGRHCRVWRCTLDAAGGPVPRRVVMKQVAPAGYDPGNPGAQDTRRFLGDWAGAQFLSAVCAEPHGPRFYGGDLQLGFIILEDLGEHRSLVEPLLEGDRRAATRALLAHARRLGRMHAGTLGHEAEYDAIVRAINPAAQPRGRQDRGPYIDNAIDQVGRLLAGIGVGIAEEARREMRALYGAVYGFTPFRTFIHTDPCPDNFFYDGENLRAIDFEWSRFGHALHDGLYCRVPFPSCWCANRVPPDVVAQAEQVYRAELAAACPAAADDDLFYAGVADVTAFWACEGVYGLEWALKEDREWGIAGVNSRLLTRLETFIAAADAYRRWPALRAMCAQALEALARLWPDVQTLPVYPAFREHVEEAR
jgi:hypothetical protein